ncbi:unnamed protein product, partial [Citrullus colocynthis]
FPYAMAQNQQPPVIQTHQPKFQLIITNLPLPTNVPLHARTPLTECPQPILSPRLISQPDPPMIHN